MRQPTTSITETVAELITRNREAKEAQFISQDSGVLGYVTKEATWSKYIPGWVNTTLFVECEFFAGESGETPAQPTVIYPYIDFYQYDSNRRSYPFINQTLMIWQNQLPLYGDNGAQVGTAVLDGNWESWNGNRPYYYSANIILSTLSADAFITVVSSVRATRRGHVNMKVTETHF